MNTSAQNLTSPKWGSSNPHGQHSTTLRSPNVANAKINNLRHLFLSAKPAYALSAHPHGELILADHDSLAHLPRLNAVFLCVLSAYARFFMVGLKGDTFEYASYLTDWSANPLQSYRPNNHLAVIGKTSIISLGVTT